MRSRADRSGLVFSPDWDRYESSILWDIRPVKDGPLETTEQPMSLIDAIAVYPETAMEGMIWILRSANAT